MNKCNKDKNDEKDKAEAVTVGLGKKYDVRNIEGMTLHIILTSLADAERMYEKNGFAGLAENAREAYKTLLSSITEARNL